MKGAPLPILLEKEQQVFPRDQKWLRDRQRAEVVVHCAPVVCQVGGQHRQLVVRVAAGGVHQRRASVAAVGTAPVLRPLRGFRVGFIPAEYRSSSQSLAGPARNKPGPKIKNQGNWLRYPAEYKPWSAHKWVSPFSNQ